MWPSGICSFATNTTGRDLVVGDIHGAFTKLQHALDAIDFDPSRDRLFSVGDLVDRGPESDHVIDWLDKPWFHAICGNHDFMTWRRALGVPYRDVDHRRHGGEWLDGLVPHAQRAVGEGLAVLPLALEIETARGLVGLVHADCPFDDWRDLQDALRTGTVNANVANSCLWSIERCRRQYHGHVAGVHAVVHGHMTIESPQTLGNVVFIDTGGWHASGHFTFLELRKFTFLRGPGGVYTRLSRRALR